MGPGGALPRREATRRPCLPHRGTIIPLTTGIFRHKAFIWMPHRNLLAGGAGKKAHGEGQMGEEGAFSPKVFSSLMTANTSFATERQFSASR